MDQYTAGQILESSAAFSAAGSPVDPTTVTFEYAWVATETSTPGTPTTLTYSGSTTPAPGTVAKTSTGNYEVQVDTTGMADGYVIYVWRTTGAGQTVGTGTIRIVAPPF